MRFFHESFIEASHIKAATDALFVYCVEVLFSYIEVAATAVVCTHWKGEAYHRRNDGIVQGAFATGVISNAIDKK